MTAREIFEAMLIETSKLHAPSLLLLDFNYFFNKAINQYINKRYNIYDVNLLTTDDIRVLKSTQILKPIDLNLYKTYDSTLDKLYGAISEVMLPKDYLHLLNCICVFKVNKNYKCYDKDTLVQFPAKRLTADSWSGIVNDFYQRPLPERPYYYIHNVNSQEVLPTNPYIKDTDLGTDMNGEYSDKNSNFKRTISLKGIADEVSTVDKPTAIRYSNPSGIRMEIRYGKDNTVFKLDKVLIDYIKAPQFIRLTQEQVDKVEDTSQIMEFPDYICQEIINELVHIVMENSSDPRLLTHIPVSLSIANPAQALTQQPQAEQA